MRPELRRSLVGAVVLLTALAACSDGGGRPTTLPPVSPSVVASAEPSPSASPTEEQAVEQAVRFYLEGFNRAFRARDASELARASVPACNCRQAVDVVEEALSLGAVEGNELTIEEVVVTSVDGTTATADAQYSTAPGKVLSPDGKVAAELTPETRTRRGIFLTKNSGRWLVARVEVLRG